MSAALFCFGVIVGLVFGPAKERLDSVEIDGWIKGYRAAKNERRRHERISA